MAIAEVPNRFLVRTHKILDNTDPTEYVALDPGNVALYNLIISAGTVDLSDNTTTRAVLWAMFGEGTTTRANLESLLPTYVPPLP